MAAVKDIAKTMFEKGKMYAFHKEQNNYAEKILKVIESEKGKLNPKNIKLCKDYAKETFGSEKYAPWLFVYSAFAREFKEGWIPDNYYGEIVVPGLKGEYGFLCNRSAVISKLVEEKDSLDLCYFVNHLFFNTDYEIINEDKIKKNLFSQNKKVVYKLENSFQGKGIYILKEESFDVNIIKKLGNGVFQSYIDQHSFFSEFNNSSVATIRITSISDDNGDIDIKAGFLKFGQKNDTHVKTASAIKIPIDILNGELYEDAYFPNWSSTKYLPDNDISFAGKVLPSFSDCITEVKKMHSRIPFVRCVGWDLIVDNNNNVRLIELNGGHNGIRFHEMTQGPCFKGLNWENLNKLK